MSNTAQRFDKLITQQIDISYFCIYSPCFPLHLVESSTCVLFLSQHSVDGTVFGFPGIIFCLWLSRNRFFPPPGYSFNTQLHEQWYYSFQGTLINRLRNFSTVCSHLQHSLIHLPLNLFNPSQILPWLIKITFLINLPFYPAFMEPEGSITGHKFQSLDSTKGTSTHSTRPNHTSLTPILMWFTPLHLCLPCNLFLSSFPPRSL